MTDCLHERVERDVNSTCYSCGHADYRVLDCSDCGARVAREGDDGFEERYATAPWWYDVPTDYTGTFENTIRFLQEPIKLPVISINRGGIRWPTA